MIVESMPEIDTQQHEKTPFENLIIRWNEAFKALNLNVPVAI